MGSTLRRIRSDVRRRHNLDAYVVSLVAAAFSIVSVIGGVLPQDLLWSVLLAGIALLVYRLTIPNSRDDGLDVYLGDRVAFDARPFPDRVRGAKELWIYAPSAVNILSPAHCDVVRTTVLSRPGGVLRVVVQDPSAPSVDLIAHQLDGSVDFAIQTLQPSIIAVLDRLAAMRRWRLPGSVDVRLLGFSPGFSLVAIDPDAKHGTVIVELHGFRNESTSARMHLEFSRADSPRWYVYWLDQFRHIWAAGQPVPTPPDSGQPVPQQVP